MRAKSRTQQSEMRRRRLLALLADGAFHSGQTIARKMRLSRAGVWKLVQALRDLGIEVESIPRQGYRLPHAVDLLSRDAIRQALAIGRASCRARVENSGRVGTVRHL